MDKTCPVCHARFPLYVKVCGKCGAELVGAVAKISGRDASPAGVDLAEFERVADDFDLDAGERKQVTVLFSDLSGYTELTEHHDPEEVKEVMLRIFGRITQVVTRYEGFIERFIGDSVMAVFGVPRAHEDDAVRAIRAAQEMHAVMAAMAPELTARVGRPLSLHSGIDSGLVVTGAVSVAKGLHGICGDTVNTAARLAAIARPAEILVGRLTRNQAQGHFDFEAMAPVAVKGKHKPIRTYKVKASKPLPRKTHNLSGIRAEMIGRSAEMGQLRSAFRVIEQRKGAVVIICGEAGTGKSRLVEEFRAELDLGQVNWIEGHAFAYAQNIPYFPFVGLFNQVFHIEEGDSPEKVHTKIETTAQALLGFDRRAIPYVGSLYTIKYPELETVSPESWKTKLQDAGHAILRSLARRGPTVVCMEDLHWADPSSIDLLRGVLSEEDCPILFICTYRPIVELLERRHQASAAVAYCEVRLENLAPPEAEGLVESLLRTRDIPAELKQFLQERAEGNPFFLEEIINSLIESEVLVQEGRHWQLIRPISESDISSSVQSLIAARLDRLEKDSKRLLQESSIIGRSFFYDILQRITVVGDIAGRLAYLEQHGLIRLRSSQPDREYVFKHSLTQEVVYNGILKKERLEIHRRIAVVIEQLFQKRLPEFFETLAYHFSQAQSEFKAAYYLMKSGDKALRRYSVEEAHRHFEQAFAIIKGKGSRSRSLKRLLIDLLIQWSRVFYYRGDFKGLEGLLHAHIDLGQKLADKSRLGMLYAWYGFALFCREKLRSSYQYLQWALELGEEAGDRQVISTACTWLAWTCADLGLFEDGIRFGRRAKSLLQTSISEPILFFQSLGGISFNHFYQGDSRKNLEIGQTLLEHGERTESNRSLVVGYISIGHSHFVAGDIEAAISSYQQAAKVARDPFYIQWPRLFIAMCLAQTARVLESEAALREVVQYGKAWGCESISSPAYLFQGVLMIRRGHMSQGLRIIRQKLLDCRANERIFGIVWIEYLLGKIFLQLAERREKLPLMTAIRNMGFLVRYLPTAARRASQHFQNAIAAAQSIGARGILGQAYLDLGHLYQLVGRREAARQCLIQAAEQFEGCGAASYLEQARAALKKVVSDTHWDRLSIRQQPP